MAYMWVRLLKGYSERPGDGLLLGSEMRLGRLGLAWNEAGPSGWPGDKGIIISLQGVRLLGACGVNDGDFIMHSYVAIIAVKCGMTSRVPCFLAHSIVAVPGNIVTDDGNSIDSAIGGRWRLLSILRNHRRKFSGSDDSSENICMYMKKLWESLCNKLDVSPSPYPLNQDEIKTSVTIHWLISTIHAWKVLERIEFVVKFFETQSISTVSLENVSIYYNSSIAHQEVGRFHGGTNSMHIFRLDMSSCS